MPSFTNLTTLATMAGVTLLAMHVHSQFRQRTNVGAQLLSA